ncbi:hypothetical protein TNCV_3872141 [Trichonephila clavipes]|nr:hypothetical protein TNCV_3872141 [Trichonephila clavipes]
MKTSSVDFNSQQPNPLPMKNSPLVSMKKEKRDVPLRTAYSQAGRLWQPKPSSLRAQAQLMRTETVKTLGLWRKAKAREKHRGGKPIAASNFDIQSPPQRKELDLRRCETASPENRTKNFILPRAPKPNRHFRDL